MVKTRVLLVAGYDYHGAQIYPSRRSQGSLNASDWVDWVRPMGGHPHLYTLVRIDGSSRDYGRLTENTRSGEGLWESRVRNSEYRSLLQYLDRYGIRQGGYPRFSMDPLFAP